MGKLAEDIINNCEECADLPADHKEDLIRQLSSAIDRVFRSWYALLISLSALLCLIPIAHVGINLMALESVEDIWRNPHLIILIVLTVITICLTFGFLYKFWLNMIVAAIIVALRQNDIHYTKEKALFHIKKTRERSVISLPHILAFQSGVILTFLAHPARAYFCNRERSWGISFGLE